MSLTSPVYRCAWMSLGLMLLLSLSACVHGPSMTASPVSTSPEPPARLQTVSRGSPGTRGNLLGIQPWLTPDDYASEARFDARLRELLTAARGQGLLNPRTVVILPEYLGTWLVVAHEAPRVRHASTSTQAMTRLVLRHPLRFLGARTRARGIDKTTDALFRLKASSMAEIYARVLSSLARDFQVTIVGGSILLPGPHLSDGRLVVEARAPLANVSLVFGPSGAVLGAPISKVFLTRDEQPFVAPGSLEALPVIETPAGRLGVLVCADAWFPQAYQALKAGGAELVAVPTFISGDASWTQPWNGYSGQPTPADVVPTDIGTLTEGEAWKRYTLPGRIAESGARAGVLVQLRGRLWELGASGEPLTVLEGEAQAFPTHDGPMLINVWL